MKLATFFVRCLLYLATATVVAANNPFSSNVVALTPQNWKEIVVDNPHAVFVNICRVG